MNATIDSYHFNKETGDMEITVKCDSVSDNMKLLWQKRQNSDNLSLYEGKYFISPTDNGIAKFKININDILDSGNFINTEIIWDCYYVDGNRKIGVHFPEPHPKFDYHFFENNNLYKVVPFVTKGTKTLALFIRTVEINSYINTINVQNKEINGALELNSKEIDIQKLELQLCLRKRDHISLTEYSTEAVTNLIYKKNKYHFKDGFQNFFRNLKDRTSWDIFVKIKNSECEIYIKANVVDNTDIKNNMDDPFFAIKPLKTPKNSLTFNIKQKELKALVTSVTESDNYFNLQGSLPSIGFTEYSLVCKLRGNVGDTFEYFKETENQINIINNSSFNVNVSLTQLIRDLKDKDIWDLFIRGRKDNEFYLDIPLSSTGNQKLISTDRKASLFVNGSGTFSIWVNINREAGKNLTNIAVLGTCYSRNAFNTSDYFNPYYKKLYKCSYTQFHSNVISLVSEPVEFVEEDFFDSGLKPSDISYIRSDFQKDFFDNLNKNNPDYLIVDFYVDACREVIQINENQYITLNYLLPQTKYYKELKGKNVVSHINNGNYFELWKRNLEIFVEKLLKVIPEEKIILNRGRLTPKYKDSNGQIIEFPEQETIKRNNVLWDRMDNYFLQLLPNVKIIDMRSTNYIGHYKHPFGKSYAHYESGYYKEFISKLNEIVLIDGKQ